MGERTDYPGIEQHRGKLRICFAYQGSRRREPLNVPATPANWPKAFKLRQEIVRKINLGTFDYASYFPNSKSADTTAQTFAQVSQEWIDQLELAHSTLESYEQILNFHWLPKFGGAAIGAITPGRVARALIECGFKTVKRRNNCISPMKMVFEYAVGERYIKDSPASGIDHKKTPKREPEPFSLAEARKILAWLKENRDEQTHNYFWFAFFSGLRPSEIMQLQWGKVDFNCGLVRVDEALVRSRVKGTKTDDWRDVELNSESRAALLAQKSHTYLAGKHVFINPNTKRPYYNHQATGLAFNAALKAMVMRHRPAYNARHTFATMNLMAGANPMWVSKQMGHASMEMTLKVYSKWITGADLGREKARIETMLSEAGGIGGGKVGASGGI